MANVTFKLNHIYYGDCAGAVIKNNFVGIKQIYHVTLTAIDWWDSRTEAGLIGRVAGWNLLGGLLGGPIGMIIGSGIAAHSWNKNSMKQVYHVNLEYGEGLKGKAWVDEKTMTYFKSCAK